MGWAGWRPIANNKIIVASVHEPPNKHHLFARDTSDNYYHWGDEDYLPDDDRGWVPFGGVFVAPHRTANMLSAASWGQGRIDVVSIASDPRGALHPIHRFRENFPFGEWTEWKDLGGPGTFDECPAVTSERPGQLNLFATSSGLLPIKVIHRWYVNGQWSGGDVIDSSGVQRFAACSWGAGRQDIFGVGPVQNNVVHKWYENGWSQFESLGGWTDVPPAVSTWPGRVDVFISGGDRSIYHKIFLNGGWSPEWTPLGGVVHDDHPWVAASGGNGGPLRVYHTGTDLRIYGNWWM
jgi:hypothetical protein